MQKKGIFITVGVILIFIAVLLIFVKPTTQSIFSDTSLSNCEEDREKDSRSDFKCILPCQLITSNHVACRNVDIDEVGEYAHFSSTNECDQLDASDLEQVMCFYGRLPFEDICSVNSDCDFGFKCMSGQCIRDFDTYECIIDTDCQAGLECDLSTNKCVAIHVGDCNDDTDCASNEQCLNNECTLLTNECSIDSDCLENQRCINNECIDIGDECLLNSDCPTDMLCENGTCKDTKPFELSTGAIIAIIIVILVIGGFLYFTFAKKG